MFFFLCFSLSIYFFHQMGYNCNLAITKRVEVWSIVRKGERCSGISICLVMSSELSEKLITWLHSANQKARNSTKIEKP